MVTYDVIDLGIGEANGIAARPTSLNNRSTVVGCASGAFIWQAGILSALPPVVPGGACQALDVNDHDEAVGWATSNEGNVACLWKSGQISIVDGPNASARAINDAGEIAGGMYPYGTVLWKNGVRQSVQAPVDSYFAQAHAINSTSALAGSAQVKDRWGDLGPGHQATIWNHAAAVPTVYNSEPYEDSFARAINDSGMAAGCVRNHPNESPCVWLSGQQSLLPLPAGATFGSAYDINAAGMCCGYYVGTNGVRACSWFGSVVTDLNALIDPASGWTLQFAHCVNDRGEFAGTGVFQGASRCWLLRPRFWLWGVPEEAREIEIPPETWQLIYGVQADGPGFVIGPRGAIRVPPWNPVLDRLPAGLRPVVEALLAAQLPAREQTDERSR
jgi:uncharacterized membrane protein